MNIRNAQEMVRVLKPGGILEVIEEDLLFPCPDSPNARTPRASTIPRVRTEHWDDGLSTHSTIREQDRRSPVFAPHNSDSESDDDSSYEVDTSPKQSPTTIRHNLWRFDFEPRDTTPKIPSVSRTLQRVSCCLSIRRLSIADDIGSGDIS